jgi:hypothetical protein
MLLIENCKQGGSMCPYNRREICVIAGIEPGSFKCVDRNCCLGDSSKWEQCRVFIAHVSLLVGIISDKVA